MQSEVTQYRLVQNKISYKWSTLILSKLFLLNKFTISFKKKKQLLFKMSNLRNTNIYIKIH